MSSVTPHARRLCGARLRKNRQGTCRQPAMANGRCRMHGGKTPVGIASASFRHGRQSRYLQSLPPVMRERYEHARTDPQLVSLIDEIALTDAGVADLLERMRDGDVPPPKWADAEASFRAFEDAQRANDTAGMVQALTQHRAFLRRGATYAEAWEQLSHLLNLRIKLVATESRRQHQQQELVDRGQFGQFARAVLLAVANRVTDVHTKSAIQEDVMRILDLAHTVRAS